MIKGYTNDLQHGKLEHTLTDAYWLRVFAGQAMQGVISNAMTHKQIIEQGNGLDKMCDVTATACIQYAQALLTTIKRVEVQDEQL